MLFRLQMLMMIVYGVWFLENNMIAPDITDSNPVRFEDGAWYWWDETWSDRTGPFDTYGEAEASLADYCEQCLGE